MSSSKLCPMMFALRDEGPTSCKEEECGWWHKYKKECAITVLANTFTLYQKYGIGSKSDKGFGGGRQGEF